MKPRQSPSLPPNFENPFQKGDPDEVWGQIKKTAIPLTREEEELLRNRQITLTDVRNKDKG